MAYRLTNNLKFSSLFCCDTEEVDKRFTKACEKLNISKWRCTSTISEVIGLCGKKGRRDQRTAEWWMLEEMEIASFTAFWLLYLALCQDPLIRFILFDGFKFIKIYVFKGNS